MSPNRPKDYCDHLLDTYLLWKSDPQRYSQKMADVVESIIRSVVATERVYTLAGVEDTEDLLQELRLNAFRCLSKVVEPTNKRLFNYLKHSTRLKIKEHSRGVGKRLEKKSLYETHAKKTFRGYKHDVIEEPILNFEDERKEGIVRLAYQGYDPKDICEKLSISRRTYTRLVRDIKKEVLG